MNKTKKYCFFISIAVNVLFISIGIYLYVGGARSGEKTLEIFSHLSSSSELTWTKRAALEAEAVAAVSCSGHGRAFVDTLAPGGQPVCECNGCYNGTDCSVFDPECPAMARSGDMIFLEPFWIENAAESAVVISGWHRMSYSYGDSTTMSSQVEEYIRTLHSVVGNAITEGRYIVFGVGSAQLLSAAVYALSSENISSPSSVLAAAPYYWLFKDQTSFFNAKTFNFEGNTNSSQSNETDLVEFVTSPNNPDGGLKEPVKGRKTINDHVFFWPQFTPIPSPSDQDVMIFSLSKLTGHAGSRFGWAIIKDKDVYEKFLTYASVASAGVSRDTQLRVLKILKLIVEGNGKSFFEFTNNKMKDRWDSLTSIMSKSKRFSIQERQPLHCTFFNETREPNPAFAWVKCEREEDDNCNAVLDAGKVIGRPGTLFDDSNRYTRLSLTQSEDDFKLLMKRLTELVDQENGGNEIVKNSNEPLYYTRKGLYH
ncbi:tryptophan aminotransferase-related protein 4-like [Bidens hawaiensis]|uniref:tryptophan aminotransferase-related protein 4-like n=1 Tax=Bidens hawaiensis TaxID=980011 RepID=UPI00404AD2CC